MRPLSDTNINAYAFALSLYIFASTLTWKQKKSSQEIERSAYI